MSTTVYSNHDAKPEDYQAVADAAYEGPDVETTLPRDADAPGYTLDDAALDDDDLQAGRMVSIRESALYEDYVTASSDGFRDSELDENKSKADTGATVDTTGTDAELASDGMDQGGGGSTLVTTDAPD